MLNNWPAYSLSPDGDLIFIDGEDHKNIINHMYDLVIANPDDERFLQKVESFLPKNSYYLFQRTNSNNWAIMRSYTSGYLCTNYSDSNKKAKCYISTTSHDLSEIRKDSYTAEDINELEELDLIKVIRDKKNQVKSIETNLDFNEKNIDKVPFVFMDNVSKPLSLEERKDHYSLVKEKYSIIKDIESYIKYALTVKPNSERKKDSTEFALQQTNIKQKKIEIANIPTPSNKIMIINIAPRDYDAEGGLPKFKCYLLDVPNNNTALYECYDESFKSNIAEEKILEKQKEKEKDGGWYSPWVHGTYPKKPNIHFIYFDYIKTDNIIELG